MHDRAAIAKGVDSRSTCSRSHDLLCREVEHSGRPWTDVLVRSGGEISPESAGSLPPRPSMRGAIAIRLGPDPRVESVRVFGSVCHQRHGSARVRPDLEEEIPESLAERLAEALVDVENLQGPVASVEIAGTRFSIDPTGWAIAGYLPREVENGVALSCHHSSPHAHCASSRPAVRATPGRRRTETAGECGPPTSARCGAPRGS